MLNVCYKTRARWTCCDHLQSNTRKTKGPAAQSDIRPEATGVDVRLSSSGCPARPDSPCPRAYRSPAYAPGPMPHNSLYRYIAELCGPLHSSLLQTSQDRQVPGGPE